MCVWEEVMISYREREEVLDENTAVHAVIFAITTSCGLFFW